MTRFRNRRWVWVVLTFLIISGSAFLLYKEILLIIFYYNSYESTRLLGPGEWPTTVDEAVAMLLDEMSEEDKEIVRSTPEEEIIVRFHHGLGTWIRNRFGLWRDNKALLQSCGKRNKFPNDPALVATRAVWESIAGPIAGENIHPDEASTVIIYAFWESLQ